MASSSRLARQLPRRARAPSQQLEELMSCRTGPLNFSRRFKLHRSSRWSESSSSDQRKDQQRSSRQDKVYTPRSGRPTRSGPVRQDILLKKLPKSSSYYAETPDCSESSPAYPSTTP